MKGIGQGMKEFKKSSKLDPAEENSDLSNKEKAQ
jgi:Sec-independent protein translocase protein TatA